MTVAILDIPTPIPTARAMMERALDPHILIGMPHLTPHGLSETWLMKELGHRHWLLLAREMGMDNADFRTAEGTQAYAAICATALRGARLDRVSANDVLTIRSLLSPVSRTQMSSTHRLLSGTDVVGKVELISTFVHRRTKGDNHSIARVQLTGRPPSSFIPNALARTAAEMRANRDNLAPEGFGQDKARSIDFLPSTSEEFNGAGLFYFAEFQALMERAVERLCPSEAAASRISDREMSSSAMSGSTRGWALRS